MATRIFPFLLIVLQNYAFFNFEIDILINLKNEKSKWFNIFNIPSYILSKK